MKKVFFLRLFVLPRLEEKSSRKDMKIKLETHQMLESEPGKNKNLLPRKRSSSSAMHFANESLTFSWNFSDPEIEKRGARHVMAVCESH